MKDIGVLKSDLEHHVGQAGLFKFLFIADLIAIGIYLIFARTNSELWVAIIALVGAGLFGMAWSWELSRISHIKDDINNR